MPARLEVADIFRHHGEAYRQAHHGHLGRVERRVMSAVELCRTAALGGHVEGCRECGTVRVAYNSRRNRHCPRCQGQVARDWIAARESELLPVPYFHVVFTLPAELEAITYQNKVSDGVDAPTQRHLRARMVVSEPLQERASMEKVSIIGLDLAKSTIQVHAASVNGPVLSRRKVSSKKLLAFLSGFDPCIVVMEACAGSHHWGREIAKLGHQVKLIAPIYVKPFVKRQKNDAADAEAICEAAMRPTMRFVAVKSEEKQAAATVFKVRDLLVRQKTQIINALRGLMAELGITVPQGPAHVGILISLSSQRRSKHWRRQLRHLHEVEISPRGWV